MPNFPGTEESQAQVRKRDETALLQRLFGLFSLFKEVGPAKSTKSAASSASLHPTLGELNRCLVRKFQGRKSGKDKADVLAFDFSTKSN